VAFGTVPASTGSVVGERPEPVLGNTATTTTTPPTAPKISFASPSVTAEVPPGFGVQEGSPGD
jgi:hypothetical protein